MSRLAGQTPLCGVALESAKRDDIIGFQRDARAPLEGPRHYPAPMSEGSQPSDVVPTASAEPWVSEPGYREGAADLLGILAYGALAAFDRLAEDARRAPTLADKVYMASLAALQIKHFETVRARLSELDVDVMAAMKPFHAPFDQFHAHTKPKDWLEGLVLAYLGNGFAADFYREVAAFVDAYTRAVVHQVLADEGHADFVIEEVRAAIAADPRVAGRLALWGRRLVGEALSQAQRVAANREALTHLLTGTVDRPGMDLAAISRMFSRLVENHTRRMANLGLQS
jgi:tRNA-(MS[2]IO[6]A)-hydroxylase (MiaE)-like